eukprot:GHVT01007319.1.p1 GENE.GHVT01007319.1~~GHVT01007319.1.p1  ORF type:complete len:188 (+),score=52.21 GHVT01007319.1:1123-1686(+)
MAFCAAGVLALMGLGLSLAVPFRLRRQKRFQMPKTIANDKTHEEELEGGKGSAKATKVRFSSSCKGLVVAHDDQDVKTAGLSAHANAARQEEELAASPATAKGEGRQPQNANQQVEAADQHAADGAGKRDPEQKQKQQQAVDAIQEDREDELANEAEKVKETGQAVEAQSPHAVSTPAEDSIAVTGA